MNASIPSIPTEADLAKLSAKDKKARCSQTVTYINSLYKRLLLFEFSRDRKSMSVVVEKGKSGKTRSSTKKFLFCKGAPESVLERCTHFKHSSDSTEKQVLTDSIRESILEKVQLWGEEQTLRVLAFAQIEDAQVPVKVNASQFTEYESGMTFIGLIGMLDPPRPEVRGAIERCKVAGIRVIVITGDNKKTAESICRQIGVFGPEENLKDKSFTGTTIVLLI